MNDFFRRMKEQEDMIRRFAEGPLGDPVQRELILARASELSRTIERDAVARFARLSSPEFTSSLDAVSRQTELFFARMRTPEFLTAMDRAVETRRQMVGVLERMALPYKSFDTQLMSMASRIDATLKALPTFDFDKIGSLIAAAEPRREMLALATQKLIFRHAALIEQLALLDSPLQSLPSFVTEQPTLGVFVHTSAVRSITRHEPMGDEAEGRSLSIRVEITDETVIFLEQTLPELSPPFLEQYRGARARATDRGPDWWTQIPVHVQEALLLTKFEHWIYETEIRAFLDLSTAKKEGALHFLPFGPDLVLREVILGPFCQNDVASVRELTRKVGDDIKVSKARLGFKHFEVKNDGNHKPEV